MTKQPRVLVFAYHDVGYACLEVLLQRGANVVGLFTHEDNLKENIWFKSVAALAHQHHIPIWRPETPNTPEIIALIQQLQPDLIFSFYYRQLICQAIIDLPKLGAFNMHGSLLPRYRGRVPINWAIIHGETTTGATLHHLVKKPDAGDIVDQAAVPIAPEETAQQVFHKVTAAAVTVLTRQLPALLAGCAPRRPQDESQASYFGGRTPEQGRIDWQQSAQTIFNLIRAVTHPYPGAFTELNGKRLLIWWAKPLALTHAQQPGTVLSLSPLTIAAQSGALIIADAEWENGEGRNGSC